MVHPTLILPLLLVAVGAVSLRAEPPLLGQQPAGQQPAGQQPAAQPIHRWYSPLGKTCPWYAYEPRTPGSRAEAKAACQKINGAPCVAHRGTALPVCP
jgi:hypothetical protein